MPRRTICCILFTQGWRKTQQIQGLACIEYRLTEYDKFAILESDGIQGRKGRGTKAEAEENLPLLGRPLVWIGSSKDDISEMPKPVKASFGYRLRRIQKGLAVEDAKALTQFGVGVYELREALDTNAYRVMYVVKLKKAVYVLHAFMKKSKSGVGIPKPDAEMIRTRLKRAQLIDAEDDHA